MAVDLIGDPSPYLETLFSLVFFGAELSEVAWLLAFCAILSLNLFTKSIAVSPVKLSSAF